MGIRRERSSFCPPLAMHTHIKRAAIRIFLLFHPSVFGRRIRYLRARRKPRRVLHFETEEENRRSEDNHLIKDKKDRPDESHRPIDHGERRKIKRTDTKK